MNKAQDTIVKMFEKGYRVTPDGRFINHFGKELKVKIRSNHYYPQSQVVIDGERRNFHHHRIAAYCKYGAKMFEKGIVVRHLDGNPLNFSFENLALGTYSDNELDKPVEQRSAVGKLANSYRKDVRRVTMRKLTEEQVKEIMKRLDNGEKGAHIAHEYGVVKDVIYQIRRGETYQDYV